MVEKIAPEKVILLDPRQPAPGLNIFLTDIPLTQAVDDFVSCIKASSSSWGPRLQDLLTNALLILGEHQLSLWELPPFLCDDAYREGLIQTPVEAREPVAYEEACRCFREEFVYLARSDRGQAISAILNKTRDVLRSAFLLALLCARKNSLSLARLWHEQKLILVRLDRTVLGDEGCRLLAGVLIHWLFRTALRATGRLPVFLAIDEVPAFERLVGGVLTEIITQARSQGLRLLLACQHLEQLSEELRLAVLENANLKLFYRTGYATARAAAPSLAAGTEPSLSRAMVTYDQVDRVTGRPETLTSLLPILDANGQPLRLRPDVWLDFRRRRVSGDAALLALHGLAAAAGLGRLYVRVPVTGEAVALGRYVRGLPPASYAIRGPLLSLAITFPRPRFTAVERRTESDAVRTWMATLQSLPIQNCVVHVTGNKPAVVRMVDVPTVTPSPRQRQAFLRANVAAHGQAAEAVSSLLAWRRAQVEQIASGRPRRQVEFDDDDNSID